MGLSILCDPEVSDGHENLGRGESLLSVLMNTYNYQINVKNPRSGVHVWVISVGYFCL